MPRLLSRDKFPPGEFQVLHPEAGMTKPFHGSFRECVEFEMAFRRKNAALAQSLGLPADEAAVEVYIDEYNAARCIAAGYLNFVQADAAPVAQKKSLRNAVAGVVDKGKAAWAAYRAMFGAAGPVPGVLADQRAAVCAKCPQNDTENNMSSYFVKTVASEIMTLLSMMRDMNFKVNPGHRVGLCKACFCPLEAKVFAPLPAILENMPDDVWPNLDKSCWIKKEAGK